MSLSIFLLTSLFMSLFIFLFASLFVPLFSLPFMMMSHCSGKLCIPERARVKTANYLLTSARKHAVTSVYRRSYPNPPPLHPPHPQHTHPDRSAKVSVGSIAQGAVRHSPRPLLTTRVCLCLGVLPPFLLCCGGLRVHTESGVSVHAASGDTCKRTGGGGGGGEGEVGRDGGMGGGGEEGAVRCL